MPIMCKLKLVTVARWKNFVTLLRVCAHREKKEFLVLVFFSLPRPFCRRFFDPPPSLFFIYTTSMCFRDQNSLPKKVIYWWTSHLISSGTLPKWGSTLKDRHIVSESHIFLTLTLTSTQTLTYRRNQDFENKAATKKQKEFDVQFQLKEV